MRVPVGAQFPADDHRGFEFREDEMRFSDYWMPNQSLQATPVRAWVEALRRRPGVPELDR